MTMTRRGIDAERNLARSILYLTALRADRPRLIDRYIHYFGETPQCAGVAGTRSYRQNDWNSPSLSSGG